MKLIQTEDYLLLIDKEAEIKEGWEGYAYKKDVVGKVFKHFYTENSWYDDAKIVIAYYPLTKEAKELDSPMLPNPYEEVVNTNIQTRNFNKQVKNPYLTEEREYQVWERAYIEGFNDGLTQSKQFSLEDIQKAFEAGVTWHVNPNISELDAYTSFIQSLSTQQLPKEFIPEKEYIVAVDDLWQFQDDDTLPQTKLKTITNSGGKEELVGTYKY